MKWFNGLTPPNAISFSHTFMWVHMYNLPYTCMNFEVGSLIGESIGKVYYVIVDEQGKGWGRFLKCLVELDLSKPLIRGKTLLLEGKQTIVAFKYERLPKFYFQCGMLAHSSVNFSKTPKDPSVGNSVIQQYGTWLRATGPIKHVGIGQYVSLTRVSGSGSSQLQDSGDSLSKDKGQASGHGMVANFPTVANNHVSLQDGTEQCSQSSPEFSVLKWKNILRNKAKLPTKIPPKPGRIKKRKQLVGSSIE